MDRPTRLPLLTPDTASAINRNKAPVRASMVTTTSRMLARTNATTATPRSLLHTPPPTPAELASVWSFLNSWVQRVVEGDQSAASIPGFGIVFVHVHGHSIRIPHFATHGLFATRHGLKFEDVGSLVPLHRVISLAFRDIAAHCHVDEYTAKSWLEHLVQNVGERMRSSTLVELGLGIGTVTCKQRVIDGHMAQKQQGTIDPDIRPVEPVSKRPQPPRSLLAPSQALFHVLPSPEKSSSTPLKPTAPGSPCADQLSGLSRRARALAQAISPLSPRLALQKRLTDAMPWQLEVKNQDVVLDCPELDAKYPPLLDPFCRTLGVEQVDAVEKFASSDRIGSNYSLTAAQLVIRKHLPTSTASPLVFLNTSNEPDAMVLPALDIAFHPVAPPPHKVELPLVTTSGKPVFSPLPATLPTTTPRTTPIENENENENETAAARYQYYLEHVISTKDIVPMNPRWTEHIQKLVARALQQLPQARAEYILRAMFDETLANYYFSIKKAVLDYLLLREGTQHRLHIPGGTPAMYQVQMKWKWGEGYAHAIAPTRGWIDRKLLAKDHLSQYLMILDSHLLALHYLWGDFDHLLLVDLPTTEELASHLVPMDIKTFEKRQLTQASHVKRLLLDKWFGTAKRILTTAKNEDVLASALLQPKHYFDCVAALMSMQLRGLIVRSIDAYVAFFRKHSQGSSSSPLKGLLLSLQLDHTNINFATSLDDATAALLNVLFNIPACFTHVDRVETKFEPSIILGGSPFLWGVGLHEDEVVRASDEIKAFLTESMVHANSVRTNYAKYAMVAAGDAALEAFMAAPHDIAAYATEIGKYMRFAMQIAAEPHHGQCPSGLFLVDCTSLNAGLIQKASRFIQSLFHAFSQVTIQINMDIRQQFKLMVSRLSKKPVDLYELVDAEAYLTKLRTQELLELFRSVQDVKHRIQFLIEQVELVPTCPVISGLSVASELLSSTAKTFEWKNQIEKVIRDGEVALQNERMRIETTFIAKRSRFQAELEELESEVNSFQKKSDLRHATTYVGQLAKVRDAILQARHTIDTIADEEAKLGWVQTDFLQLDTICETLEPYDQLWRTARDFREASVRWMRGNIFELDAKGNERAIHTMTSTLLTAAKQLAETSPAAASATETLRKQIAEFKESIGLISVMGNPNLRDRHWSTIATTVGFVIDPTEHLTLQRLLDMGVQDHITALLEISNAATMEAEIERSLDAMAEEWLHMEFQFVLVASSESYVLADASIADVHTKLDDHVVKTQAIRSSPYKKPFFGRAIAWERSLLKLRDVTELLSETGKAWVTIEPLFASKADVPVLDKGSPEAKKFALADGHWRSIMAAVVARPLCLAVIQIDKAADRLRECKTLLEGVLEGLNACLELKRSLFPRFFFLSNAELIRALSTHPDALTTRKSSYLARCFPGIGRIELNSVKEITNVTSSLHESIALSQVVPTEKVATDIWLARLEQGLYTSMQVLLRSAMSDYSKKDFRKWYLLWPEQAVLVIERYMWTNKIESCLREPSSMADAQSLRPHKLHDYLATELEPRIADLAQELREGTHTALHRINLVTSLIAQLVHARDCTSDLIAHEPHLADADAFLWQSQLRVAWNDGNVLLKVLKCSVLYGNEYLGNAKTLIVTPNTLKVARVVCNAMAMAKGSAVVGASSTGKATTLHMLASACGKLCMVFECVAHIDAFTRIIKGAAATGTWLLLRNAHNVFGHATIGVLTDLLHRVQEATGLREASVVLHGTKLRLRRGVHISATFTTSQPLPRTHDAFLSLFRPVTLIAPDVEIVCRVLCDLAGFGSPEMLGKHVSFVLATAAKLFPVAANAMQSLRLVKTVVDRTKKLVLKEHSYDVAPSTQLVSIEAAMLLQVLGDVLSSVVPPSDATAHILTSFLETLASSAPLLKPHELPHDVMTLALKAQCATPTPPFLLKLQQLYAALSRPQGVVLLGPTMSGKTTLYQTLSHALRLFDERSNPYAHRQSARSGLTDSAVLYQVVSPRSLSFDELYGRLSPTKTFDDGVLTLLLRRLHARSKLDAHGRFWLVLDGALSPSWTDGLHSLLEQDGYLSVLTGERLALPPQTRLLFEATGLVDASPAILTRTAIVHVAASNLSWRQLYDSWWAKQDDALQELTDVKDAMDSVLDLIGPCLQFAKLHFRAASFGPTSLGRMQSFLAILNASVRAAWPKMASMTAKQLYSVGHCAFLLGLIWGIGHTSAHDERVKFDNFLRALAGEPTATTVATTTPTPVHRGKRFQLFFPSNRPELVYAFGLSVDWGLKWELWVDIVPTRLLSVPMPLRSIKELFIPTANSTAVIHFTELFVQTAQHVLLVGPPSTGKSAVVDALCTQSLLRQRENSVLAAKASVFALVPCGVRTSPSSLLSSLQDHLERSRKNVLSAPPHKTCVLFLDDVSLPFDQDGTLAFLRHLLSAGAIYEPNTHAETFVSGIALVGSVTELPSQSWHTSSERFVARLVPLAFPELQASDMNKLLLDVGSWCVSSRSLSVDFAQMLPTLIKATMRLFVSCNERFRVSPTRPHYIFRLDDMLQLTQAIARDCAATQFSDKTLLVRLWCHEATRTLADRLASATELAAFSSLLRDICTSSFAVAHEALFPNLVAATAAANTVLRRASDDMQSTTHRSSMLGTQQVTPVAAYLHANFLRITFATLLPSTTYDEIDASDMVELLSPSVAAELSKLTETSARPNAINNDVQLQLPFFIEHIIHLARVLRPPAGPTASFHPQHVLVWGPPGTGKATMSRLAAGVAGNAATYLNVQNPLFASHTTWQRAINDTLLRAAAHPTPSVLVIKHALVSSNTHEQKKRDEHLVDMAELVNERYMPHFVTSSDLEALAPTLRTLAKAENVFLDTQSSVEAYFAETLRRKLTFVLVLTMPVHAPLTWQRHLQASYAHLFRRCHVHHVSMWPKDTLRAMVHGTCTDAGMADAELYLDAAESLFATAKAYETNLCPLVPSRFVLHIASFARLWQSRVIANEERKAKLVAALDALRYLERLSTRVAQTVKGLTPEISRMSQVSKGINVGLETESQTLLSLQAQLSAEDDVRIAAVAKLESLQAAAKSTLDGSTASVLDAKHKLEGLSTQDMAELCSLHPMPPNLRYLLECMCRLLQLEPVETFDERDIETKFLDYTIPARQWLLRSNGLDELKNLGTDFATRLDGDVLGAVSAFYDHVDFTPTLLAKLHPSGGPLCAWARAIIQYKMTHVMLEPQWVHIKDAQVIADGCEIKCAQLRRAVDTHVATMQVTTTSRATTDTHVRELTTQLSDSTESNEKAQSLLSALMVFVSAWHQRRDECIEWGARLPAHALMATGLASYAGHVPAYGRHQLLVQWMKLLSNLGLPSSAGLLTQTSHHATYDLLIESALFKRWLAKTVPSDDPISHENVAFLAAAETYPLLIDPHEIAYTWVLAMTTDVYANETPYIVPPHDGSIEEFEKVQDDVFAAMQSERPVLVRHTNLATKSLLLPFLLAKRQASRLGGARPNFLTHKHSLLEFPTDWSLYLFTTDEAAPWLPAFATVTTPVYIELTPQIASDLFRSQVLGNASKHTLLHWQELKTSLHAAEHDASAWEDLCLSALAKAGDAILDDTAALLTWRHSYSDAVAKQVQLTYELSKATRLSLPLDVVRQRFVDLCLISNDLRHKSPQYGVTLAWLTHLLTSVLNAIGKSDAMAFLERITLTVYRALHWGIRADDRTLLNLLFALRLYQPHDEDDEDDFDEVDEADDGSGSENANHDESKDTVTAIGDNSNALDGGDDEDVGRELDDIEERAKPSWAWCWSSQEEFRFLIAPQTVPHIEALPLHCPSWLPTSRWELLIAFCDIVAKPLRRHILASWMDDDLKMVWKSFYEASKSWLMELPIPLSPLQRLCLVRVLRPDQFGAEALAFVHGVVPSEWLASAYSWSLGEMAAVASCATPLILSSQGHDTLEAIKAASISAKVDIVLATHGEHFERLLVATMKTGQWLVLRQVDTNPDWLQTLHRTYQVLNVADVHWEFRLWLCVDATDRIPLSLAQRSLTRHMALGSTFREHLFSCAYQLHAPLSSSVAPDIDATETLGSPTLVSPEWLSLCFLHALLVARTQFGVHGFKGPMYLTPRDFAIVVEHPSLDLESLVYGCNLYSPWDVAFVRLFLQRYSSGHLKGRLQRIMFAWTSTVERTASVRNLLRRRSSSVSASDMEGLLEAVEAPSAGPLLPNNITSLPIIDNPIWFGLHASLVHGLYAQAALLIATSLENTYRHWLWRQFPPAIAAAAPPSQTRVEILQYASLDKVLDAASLDLVVAQKVFPLDTAAPLHAILHAEVDALASMRDRLRSDVRRLQEALVDGAGVLPPALEPLHAAVLRNEVPASWQRLANSVQCTWTGFQAHVTRQIQFFDDWVASGVVPDVHWLGAYLEPTRFLAAWSLQFARHLNQPLHTIALDAAIVSAVDRSAGGVYVDGVVLVGASWLLDATGVHTLQAPSPESATTGPLLLHFAPRTVPAFDGLDGAATFHAASTEAVPLLRTVVADDASEGKTEVVHIVYLPSTLLASDLLERGTHLAIRDSY